MQFLAESSSEASAESHSLRVSHKHILEQGSAAPGPASVQNQPQFPPTSPRCALPQRAPRGWTNCSGSSHASSAGREAEEADSVLGKKRSNCRVSTDWHSRLPWKHNPPPKNRRAKLNKTLCATKPHRPILYFHKCVARRACVQNNSTSHTAGLLRGCRAWLERLRQRLLRTVVALAASFLQPLPAPGSSSRSSWQCCSVTASRHVFLSRTRNAIGTDKSLPAWLTPSCGQGLQLFVFVFPSFVPPPPANSCSCQVLCNTTFKLHSHKSFERKPSSSEESA